MIVFENPGEIDLRSISTFGVSVKAGDNPIGFFGTGLKYAIAVLLRTGHKVCITSGLEVVTFDISSESVRGQPFDFVTMQSGDGPAQSIGFTTELGKQWELWMAYREIACNCKDENGEGFYTTTKPEPLEGVTRVIVVGDAFEGVFDQGYMYILADEPYLTIGTAEVRNRKGSSFYYRGVKVMDLQSPGLYTYNVNAQMTLTEDRTVKSSWEIGRHIAKMALQAEDARFIRDVVTAEDPYFEAHLDFHGWGCTVSETFLKTVDDCLADKRTKVSQSAMAVWKDATKQTFAPKQVALTAVQTQTMERALDFAATIGFSIRGAYPISVVESLGDNTLGLAEDGTIFIAERVFGLGGTKMLAATLIEEYIHLRHGWGDMTRELQNFLFEKVVSLGEELAGEAL
jgi:hypothetical protein